MKRRLVTLLLALSVVGISISAVASASPQPGKSCKVAGRERVTSAGTLRCTASSGRSLRWVQVAAPVAATTTTTTTTSSTTTTVAASARAPQVSAISTNDSRLQFTLSGMSPDTGNYAVQWVDKGRSFTTYRMLRFTERTISISTAEFACGGSTYTFRVFVMRDDWQLADGHQRQNVTPHSEPFDVAFAHACPAPETTATSTSSTTTTTTIAPVTYSVTYNGNSPTTGAAPTDSTAYANNASVTVSSNSGALVRTGFSFGGWCTTQPAAGSACGGTARAPTTTFTITSNITLYAVWTTCATGGVCALGDTGPGGGTVFYVANTDFTSTKSDCNTACRYLEVQPVVNQTATWCNVSTNLGVSATAIGTGSTNTDTAARTCTGGAIRLTSDYTNNGKSDWHLPSFSELAELYAQRNLSGIGIGSPAVYYWSSSECTPGPGCAGTSARMYRFSDGATNISGGKTGLSNVRYLAVRAFAPSPPFAVTYDGNSPSSGSSPTDVTGYATNATVTVSGNTGTLAKAGYSFGGWCTTQPAAGAACGGTSRAAASTFSITSNTTLYAVWTANTLTVTTDEQGGSAVANASTTTGASMNSPGTPTRAGYTFAGWFTASSGGSAITFPYAHGQTASFTLYAQWTVDTLTVTTDEQGGSAVADASTTTGASMNSPGTPTRAGYTFAGWFTASSGGSAITFPYAHGQTANFTLYAQWACVGEGAVACVVGDIGPGGGIIFYVSLGYFTSPGSTCGTTCLYLEVSPASAEVDRSWATGANQTLEVGGGQARGTAIGSGHQNSREVALQAGNVAESSAAVYARSYSGGGKTDWYLPALDELRELCKYARQQTTGNTAVACTDAGSLRSGFSALSNYFASTETWANNANVIRFSDGFGSDPAGAGVTMKSLGLRARPIRAVGPPELAPS